LCRELCERHSASIGYLRAQRQGLAGNEFYVLMHLPHVPHFEEESPMLEAQDSFWAQ
jgi:hypothetical protein